MNGADAIIKCLEAEKVDYVFGYPGVAICPFYNSILSSDIKTVLVRTEQNAAHMASGLARTTQKPGVCAVTSGPGATNLLTGIATAFADSIPLICITGQVNSALLGSDVFQEADVTGAAESFVKYSYLVKDVNDIPRIFKEAFHIAMTGRKGPVLIDVPIDIQNAVIKKFEYPSEVKMRTYKPTVKGNALQLKRMCAAIEKAKKPLICVGGGIALSDCQPELLEFVEKNRIPVVSTMMGIGAMPTKHELYFGMVGNNGKPYANKAMAECDTLVMMGARVADRAVNQPDFLTENKVLIHMDVDPAEIGKNCGPTIPIVGDAKAILEDLNKEKIDVSDSEWIDHLKDLKEKLKDNRFADSKYVNPKEFIEALSDKLPDDAIYVADVGQNQIFSCAYHIVKKGKFLTSGGMGTMGYSIPAALGAKLANPLKQVVAVCGDGSLQMSMCEMATVKQENANIKIIVFKNGYLGMVREYQHFTYKDNYSVVELNDYPNLKLLAEAYDFDYRKITYDEELSFIDDFLRSERPGIMEVNINPADVVKG